MSVLLHVASQMIAMIRKAGRKDASAEYRDLTEAIYAADWGEETDRYAAPKPYHFFLTKSSRSFGEHAIDHVCPQTVC